MQACRNHTVFSHARAGKSFFAFSVVFGNGGYLSMLFTSVVHVEFLGRP
jgi:hypothetical protein